MLFFVGAAITCSFHFKSEKKPQNQQLFQFICFHSLALFFQRLFKMFTMLNCSLWMNRWTLPHAHTHTHTRDPCSSGIVSSVCALKRSIKSRVCMVFGIVDEHEHRGEMFKSISYWISYSIDLCVSVVFLSFRLNFNCRNFRL